MLAAVRTGCDRQHYTELTLLEQAVLAWIVIRKCSPWCQLSSEPQQETEWDFRDEERKSPPVCHLIGSFLNRRIWCPSVPIASWSIRRRFSTAGHESGALSLSGPTQALAANELKIGEPKDLES